MKKEKRYFIYRADIECDTGRIEMSLLCRNGRTFFDADYCSHSKHGERITLWKTPNVALIKANALNAHVGVIML